MSDARHYFYVSRRTQPRIIGVDVISTYFGSHLRNQRPLDFGRVRFYLFGGGLYMSGSAAGGNDSLTGGNNTGSGTVGTP